MPVPTPKNQSHQQKPLIEEAYQVAYPKTAPYTYSQIVKACLIATLECQADTIKKKLYATLVNLKKVSQPPQIYAGAYHKAVSEIYAARDMAIKKQVDELKKQLDAIYTNYRLPSGLPDRLEALAQASELNYARASHLSSAAVANLDQRRKVARQSLIKHYQNQLTIQHGKRISKIMKVLEDHLDSYELASELFYSIPTNLSQSSANRLEQELKSAKASLERFLTDNFISGPRPRT